MNNFNGCPRFSLNKYVIIIIKDTSQYREEITALKEDVLQIATRARGWDTPESLEEMRRNFKIEPLFEASSLALITCDEKLMGTCGVVNNWHLEESSIMHLCAANFLPEIQKTNVFPFMVALLWVHNFTIPILKDRFLQNKIYATAISQSPFVLSFFNNLFDTFPSPDKDFPDPDLIPIAEKIAEKFNPGLAFDRDSFVIKNECNFFYKDVPFTNNKAVNDYCKAKLNIAGGDVFVIVGKMKIDKIKEFLRMMYKGNEETLRNLEGFEAMLQIIR